MLKKFLVAALAAVCGLAAAAVVYANPASDTTHEVNVNASPKNSGTSRSPKSEKLSVSIDGGTKSGTGQPETTDKVTIRTPFKYRGTAWPTRSRCDDAAANLQKTNARCPRPSRVGSGRADLLAANGAIKRSLILTIHVVRGTETNPRRTQRGSLGIWARSANATDVPQINQFIPGTTRGGTITFDIPPNLEQPLGVKSAIDKITASFGGSITVSGEKVGVLESTRCSKRRWPFAITFDTFTGNLTDTDSVSCRP